MPKNLTREVRSKYAYDVYVNQVSKSLAYKTHIDPSWDGNTAIIAKFEKGQKTLAVIAETKDLVQNGDDEIKKQARSNLIKALKVSESLLDCDEPKIQLAAAGQVYSFSTAVMGLGARKEEDGLKKRPFL
jgi:hypothetical protein